MTNSVTKGSWQEVKLTQCELGSQIQESNTRYENPNDNLKLEKMKVRGKKRSNCNAAKQMHSKFKSQNKRKFWSKCNIISKEINTPPKD